MLMFTGMQQNCTHMKIWRQIRWQIWGGEGGQEYLDAFIWREPPFLATPQICKQQEPLCDIFKHIIVIIIINIIVMVANIFTNMIIFINIMAITIWHYFLRPEPQNDFWWIHQKSKSFANNCDKDDDSDHGDDDIEDDEYKRRTFWKTLAVHHSLAATAACRSLIHPRDDLSTCNNSFNLNVKVGLFNNLTLILFLKIKKIPSTQTWNAIFFPIIRYTNWNIW